MSGAGAAAIAQKSIVKSVNSYVSEGMSKVYNSGAAASSQKIYAVKHVAPGDNKK